MFEGMVQATLQVWVGVRLVSSGMSMQVSKSKKQGIVKAEAEFNGCLDATLSSIADGAVVASYDDESGNPRPIYKESLQRLASNRGPHYKNGW